MIRKLALLGFVDLHPQSYVVPPAVGRYDAELGWTLRENNVAVSKPFGYPIEYRVNSKGLRDREVSAVKGKGEFRVVLLGDSNAFGFGVRLENHFSTLVEEYVEGVEIVNLAVGGYGVDQELLRLRKEGFSYGPDLVLALVDGNYPNDRHMYSNRFGFAKPRFQLEGDELLLYDSPVPEPDTARDSVLRLPHRLMRENSAAYEGLRKVWSGWSVGQQGAALDTAGGDRADVVGLGDLIVLQIDRDCRAAGAPFMLGALDERLGRVARGADVNVVDLSSIATDRRYALPDGHLNDAGNEAVAREFALAIEEFRRAAQVD